MITIHDLVMIKKLINKYNISKVSVGYSGGADSGSINNIKFKFEGEEVSTTEPLVAYRNDLERTLPSPILDRLGVDYAIELISLEKFFWTMCDKHVANYTPRGWENGSGGGGELAIEGGAISFGHYDNAQKESDEESTFKLSLPVDEIPSKAMAALTSIAQNGPIIFGVSISEDGSYELVTFNRPIDNSFDAGQWLDGVLEGSIDEFVEKDFAKAGEDDYGFYEAEAVIKDGNLEITSTLTITKCYQDDSVDRFDMIDELIEQMSEYNNMKHGEPLGYEFIGNSVFGLYLDDDKTIKIPAALDAGNGTWIELNPESSDYLEKSNAASAARYELIKNQGNMQPIDQLMNLLVQNKRDDFIAEVSGVLIGDDSGLLSRELNESGPDSTWNGLSLLNLMSIVNVNSREFSSKSLIPILLDKGANVFTKNDEGLTHAEFMAVYQKGALGDLFKNLYNRNVNVASVRTELIDEAIAQMPWLTQEIQELELRQSAEVLAGDFDEDASVQSNSPEKLRCNRI